MSSPFALSDGSFQIRGSQTEVIPELAMQLPPDAPERTIALANGLFENGQTFKEFSKEMALTAFQKGEHWRVFRYSDPAAYSQEDHTATFLRVNEFASRTTDAPVTDIGHSRGCISALGVHNEQRELVERSVHLAPPGCSPFEIASKGLIIATLAARAGKEGGMSLYSTVRNHGDLGRGLLTLTSVLYGGAKHVTRSLMGAVDEVHEIVQSEKFKYMEGIVALDAETKATRVAICDWDALCNPVQSEINLRKSGYQGEITRFPETTHMDPLSRPKDYAPAIFQLVTR